ncbi:MAG: nuclear transport factor 2 family protein [Desulfomonile tiedjei]|nr:nuclear transport factor 2 family protein [Desulfomonile tiedjei]
MALRNYEHPEERAMAKILVIVTILVAILAPAASEGQQNPTADEDAIKQAVQSYVEAYNRGDAAAVAAHWSDDGEYVSPSGESFKGRKKIEAALKAFFKENQGLQLQVTTASLTFPSRTRAAETGTAVVTRPGQTPEETRYAATYVKKGAQWKLTSVKEEEAPVIAPSYEHLKDLEWLIGEWTDTDEHSTVETTYQWARDKSFITSSFTVNVQGRLNIEGAQVIGWDPVKKTIRSWVFDSHGGFGEGVWTKQGNQWQAKSSIVLASGEKASAINIFTHVDDNTFTFQSIGREAGGELLPNIEEVTVVRKQPAPQPATSKRGGR